MPPPGDCPLADEHHVGCATKTPNERCFEPPSSDEDGLDCSKWSKVNLKSKLQCEHQKDECMPEKNFCQKKAGYASKQKKKLARAESESLKDEDAISRIFSLFKGEASGPEPLAPGSVTYTNRQGSWSPSPPGTWFESPMWDENDVFQAQLTSQTEDDDWEWTLKIGKGGQLYSLSYPGVGELLPPQHNDDSPWTDDCFVTTLYGSKEMDGDPVLNQYGMNWLQNGYYTKPRMDPILQRPFYEPVMAEQFDPEERSYAVTNLRFTSQPSVNRSDAMMYTKYRHLGAGVLEITYYFYNFGEHTLDGLTFPWGGIRTHKMPNHVVGLPDGTFRVVGSQSVDMHEARSSGGWLGTCAGNGADLSTLAFALVHGLDPHYKTDGFDYVIRPVMSRVGDTGVDRDFTILATWIIASVMPGEGFYFRTYVVAGPLGLVSTTASKLASSADYGKLQFSPDKSITETLSLYTETMPDGQTILTTTSPEDTTDPVASSFAVPVPGSFPLLLMKEIESGRYVLTTDPYCVCSKSAFQNPYKKGDEKYQRYQNRVIYRPYDGRTEFVRLLGYVLPVKQSDIESQFSVLASLVERTGVVFAPGEKMRALDLMIWTGSPDPHGDSPRCRFLAPKLVGKGGFQSSSYQDSMATTATGNGSVSYSKVLGPAWLRVNGDGTLEGIPGIMDAGLNSFAVQAKDDQGSVDVATLSILVESNVEIVAEGNFSSKDWKFSNIPSPSPEADSDISRGHAVISIPTDLPNKGGDVTTLINGSGQRTSLDDEHSVWFEGFPSRILIDMKECKPIRQINTYAWNKYKRNQQYDLYVHDGDSLPPCSSKVRSGELVKEGWKTLAIVRTDVANHRDTQVGLSIGPKQGEELVCARYLLWDVKDPFVRFGEFDVYLANSFGDNGEMYEEDGWILVNATALAETLTTAVERK